MKRILLSLMLLALTLNPVSVYADDKDKTFHFELGGEDWNHDTIAPGELLEDKVIVENATGYPLKFRLIRTENLHDSELYGVMKYSMGGSGFVDLADITSGWFQVADGERAEVPVVGYMPETLGNEWQGKELNARFYFEGRLVEESDMSNASYQESNYGLQDNNLKDTTGELHFADGFLFDNGVDLSDVLALESIGLYSADGTLIKEFMGVSQEEGGTGVDGYFYNFPITAEELRDIIDGNNSLEKTEDFYIQKTYRVIRDYEIVWTALSNELAEWTESGGIIRYPFTYTRDSKPETPDVPDKPDEPEKPEEPDKPDEPEKPEEPGKPDKPDAPELPDRPDVPEVPDNPEVPKEPEAPSAPDVQKVSGKKEISDGSADHDTPRVKVIVERTGDGVVVKAVKTGDTSNVYGLSILLFVSMGVLVYCGRCKYEDAKKGRNTDK